MHPKAASGTNVTYVSGLSIMTNSNVGDLVHPNELGGGEIAASLAAIVASRLSWTSAAKPMHRQHVPSRPADVQKAFVETGRSHSGLQFTLLDTTHASRTRQTDRR